MYSHSIYILNLLDVEVIHGVWNISDSRVKTSIIINQKNLCGLKLRISYFFWVPLNLVVLFFINRPYNDLSKINFLLKSIYILVFFLEKEGLFILFLFILPATSEKGGWGLHPQLLGRKIDKHHVKIHSSKLLFTLGLNLHHKRPLYWKN